VRGSSGRAGLGGLRLRLADGTDKKVSTQVTDWDLLALKGDLVVWGSNWGHLRVRLVQIPSGQERMLAAPLIVTIRHH